MPIRARLPNMQAKKKNMINVGGEGYDRWLFTAKPVMEPSAHPTSNMVLTSPQLLPRRFWISTARTRARLDNASLLVVASSTLSRRWYSRWSSL
jgi:hypothetical protein